MHSFLHLAGHVSHIVALAGGGGSGGGGGGAGGGGGYYGGGSGDSGAGGGVFLALFIGLFPVQLVTQHSLSRFSYRTSLIIGAVTGVAVSNTVMLIWGYYGIATVIGAAFGLVTGFMNLQSKIKRKLFRGNNKMQLAASQDPAWQDEAVQNRVRTVFFDYQQDWSNFEVTHMKSYMSERYYRHAQLMLAALRQMGRRNVVNNVELFGIDAMDVVDSPNNADDRFSVLVAARANDQLADTANDKMLYSRTVNFDEVWWFDRDGNTWDLSRIDQLTAEDGMIDVALERFAEKHDMFYSLDWGRLLLPQRGQLFSRASFSNSDVNNHVIGQWGDLIVQLYTYAPYVRAAENYLVAQIALPKSYGGIIIKRNNSWRQLFTWTPRGYQRVNMEWPDFNKRYTVFATDMDKVTSFELLNPKFMADLYDRKLPFSIEVVDNVVYLYAPMRHMLVSGSRERYAAALDVLRAAHKELYM